MQEGLLALNTEPFDLVVSRDDFAAVQDFRLGETVDNACRHFAHHRSWPELVNSGERRAVVQRVLLALFIAETMNVSANARAGSAKQNPEVPDIEPRLVMEWLLIWPWKAGGSGLMPHYRSLLFNVLDYAGMTRLLVNG